MKTKEEKAEYDRKYRERKKEEIRLKKKIYSQSENGRAMQKRRREKIKETGYHNEYMKKPEQRLREKKRRHIRENKLIEKICIICNKTKTHIYFESFLVFPDKRNYQCKECEDLQKKELGITTRQVLQSFRSNLTKTESKLKISDIAKHPYLIEVNKYLLLLKKIIK